MRTVVETDFDDTDSEETYWQLRVYVTCDDDTITESILNIKEPQHAGQFTIIRGYLGDKGEVKTNNPTVGVSVTLDWNDGGTHQVDL